MKKKTLWLAIVVAATAIIGVTAVTVLSASFDGVAAVRVNIPRGAAKYDVCDSLKSKLGDGYGTLVYHLWSLAAGDPAVAHGSYIVEPGDGAISTAKKLAKGRQTPVRVTLNNMRTLEDLASKLGAKIEASPKEIMAAARKVLTENPEYSTSEEFSAAFLPDTYEFYWTDSPEKVIEKLVVERDNFWNKERTAKAERIGLTPVEIMTLASIIEEESNKKDELPMIARLYMNRLDQGMRLQADPTVKFALGNFALRRLSKHDLLYKSPYNTYVTDGLPPGPIRIPAKASIDAVLNAPQHNYLYMCAKDDFSGYHNFAVSYSAHQVNAARYRQALDRRGIRR